MSETVRVNFANALPLFPLPDTVLLPHAILPLHIFEPRYRQMVSECLDCSGQIALGMYAERQPAATVGGSAVHDDENGERVRSATCIGQIIRHETLSDGGYNILLHGICRARIEELIEPEGERTFCLVRLSPIEPLGTDTAPMPQVRGDLRRLLTRPALRRLRGIDTLMQWIERKDVPTDALLELIGFALVRDTELKYRLLAEPAAEERAKLITDELRYLDRMVHRAERQGHESWPKGMSWN